MVGGWRLAIDDNGAAAHAPGMRIALTVAFGTLLSLPSLAQIEDEASLRAAGARALAAVEKFLGYDLGLEPTFRFTDPDELESILDKELVTQFAVQFSDADEAKRQRKAFAAMMSRALMAKYEFATGNVLVSPGTIAKMATLLDEPNLTSEECLQAILTHEAVHFVADQLYEFQHRIGELTSTDAILAYNAVVEGHAQFVARRVCAANGWSAGFHVFTRAIGKTPDLGDDGMNMLARMQAASASWAYIQGEEFIGEIQAVRGNSIIERIYREPPESPAIISNPQWFLDPTTKPRVYHTIDAGLAMFADGFEDKEWTKESRTMNNAELETVMELLPEQDVARITEHLQTCKMQVLQSKNPPGERMIAAGVFACDSHHEATFLLACEERLMRKKDEAFKEGAIKVLDASYTPKNSGTIQGVFANKTVDYNGRKLPVSTLVLRQERLVLDVTFSNHEITEQEAMHLGRKLLRDMIVQRSKRPGEK